MVNLKKTGGIIMKILVTGANGYMGPGIIANLLKDGLEVLATDLKLDKVDKNASHWEANLFTVDNPYEYFGQPDILLHLAWRDGFKHDSINHLLDLPQHYKFISQMIESGIKQVCVLGSMHEVGFYEGSIDENTPTNPQSLYGISKNALREAVRLKASQSQCIFQWIRGYYIVGNTTEGCSIFSKIVQAEKQGVKEFPFTLGVNQYDFLDYDDFCMQVTAVVEQTNCNGIINCCSGVPERLGQRVERFIDENRFHIKLKYGAFPDRPYDSKAVWGNDSKIKNIMQSKYERTYTSNYGGNSDVKR